MSDGYDSRPPDAPARIGRYATIRRLGAGGMAEVFLARSRGAEGTDKQVVVKRILPAFAANARFRSMFVDEARVALRLNHPNVVQVYGFESDGPSLLLVMEYVDGPDLAALTSAVLSRNERIPPGLAAWIAREVARGLHYAHERRDEDGSPLEIVHRDVSPGNVMLSHDGVVKLGDFGIAKARLVSGEDEGAIKGKFAYMSPEQARTEPVDRRADVYSLGAVLGEMLAGRTLFDGSGSTGADLLPRLRRGETPDIHAVAPHAPVELRDLVARMLSSDRTERFPTAREVALALTRWLHVHAADEDAAGLEQYLVRFCARNASVPPLAEAIDDADRDALTVAHGLPRAASHVAAQPAVTVAVGGTRVATAKFDTAALMRERVHVAVLIGRVVIPPQTVDTVDTRPLMSLVEALAFKADATLERAEDGRFVLVVGVVQPHTDHALRAARLALDLVDAAQALSPDGGEHGSVGIAVGLSRGVAAAARGTSGTLQGFEVVDEAMSFASNLSEAAQVGEVLVTPALYRLVRRAFVLDEVPARTSGAATRAFRLARPRTRAEREQDVVATQGELAGRDVELSQLDEALARVGEMGTGASVFIVGEPGIGKSALCASFSHRHRDDGAVVRVPVAFGGGDRPFRCIAQLMAELLGVPDATDPAVLESAIERAVGIASIPSVAGQRAARRALRVAFGREDDDGGNEDATVREIVLVLRRLFVARAAMGPVAIVLDGVELADRQSRAVLLDLLRRPASAPVLLVVAARDDDPMASDTGPVQTLVLAPLGEGARAQLVARRLGAHEASAELVREVSAVAGGNPLMILEVLEALSERERVDIVADARGGSRVVLAAARDGEQPLPATLEEVLAARLDALPPEARALVRWCALVDAEMPLELVETLGGDDSARAVGRLVADGILVHAHGRRDVLTFAHAALARVARASIDPTQLAGMHARIAAALERGGNARGAHAAIVARHREAAGAVRPAARAYLECAQALRAQSHDREALDAFARVLELLRDARDPEAFALRFVAYGGREDIARAAGRTRARRAEIVALRTIAVEAHDPRLIARALTRQARYKLETGVAAQGIERDVAAATRAARRAGELRTEAEAKRVLAVWLGQRGRYAEAIHAADEALMALETRSALAPPPGGSSEDGVRSARTVRVETLMAKGALLRQTGEVAAAIEVQAEAYALLARFGPRRLLAHVLNNLGVACFARGDYADALRLYHGSIAVHRETGQRDRLGKALSNAGQAYRALGDDERALAFLRKAVEVHDALGGRAMGSVDAHVALAELYAARGETELALAEIEKARADADGSGVRYDAARVKLGEAVIALARREHRVARAAAEEAERISREAGLVAPAVHARAYAAEAAALGGDTVAARRYVEAVLGDPHLVDPTRFERGDLVLAACERALRVLGDVARADALAGLRVRRVHAAGPVRSLAAATRPADVAP